MWCPGGEVGFIGRMIEESASLKFASRWFTTLVAKDAHLPRIQALLTAVKPSQTRIIELAVGQKKTRILAWSFFDQRQRRAWRESLVQMPGGV